MNQTFYNGLSGLISQQHTIDALGNNIANVNTVGYKRSNTPSFSTHFSSALANSSNGPVESQKGHGTKVAAITTDIKQGSFQPSERPLDIAIDGIGWFGVKDRDNNLLFTRNGALNFDANRNLVDSSGNILTGKMAGNVTSKDGEIDPNTNKPRKISELSPAIATMQRGAITDQTNIVLPKEMTIPAEPTKNVFLGGNLGVISSKLTFNEATQATELQIVDVERKFSIEVIAENDNKNILEVIFTPQKPQPELGTAWNVSANIKDKNLNVVDTQTGSAIFDQFGGLTQSELPTLNNEGTPITVNMGEKFNGLISNVGKDVEPEIKKDGIAAGNLSGYSFNNNGQILATFDTGRTSLVAQVAIYQFKNDAGLEKIGANHFQTTSNSGNAIFFDSNQLGARIRANALENSNVDLNRALTELIVAQRSFDASSKSLTTGDDLLKNALQMGAR